MLRRSLMCVAVCAALVALATTASGAVGAASRTAAPTVVHPLLSVHAPGSSLKMSTSNNWSGYNQGYLEKSTQFTSISAQWTVPTAHQRTAGQAESSATWIGIGGGCLDTSCTTTDNTLVQAGTEQDVAADGTASYAAWWEVVPVPSVTASITVHAGDLISCSISQSAPEVWSISLQDLTDGQSFAQTVPYASDYLTAEWILETPVVVGTGSTGISALPSLSTTHFSHATVNGGPADLVSSEALQLVDASGAVLATPPAPNPGADGFNDCSYASTCAAPAS